jgi:hypothetical protein
LAFKNPIRVVRVTGLGTVAERAVEKLSGWESAFVGIPMVTPSVTAQKLMMSRPSLLPFAMLLIMLSHIF